MTRQGGTTDDDIQKMRLDIYNAENGIVDLKVKKNNRKKIVDICIMAVLILLTLFFVLRAVTSKASGEPVSIFGVYVFSVETASMEPTLNVNDIFVAKKLTVGTTLKIGDIITFTDSAGRRVTHRITNILIEGGVTKYETKGDNIINSIDPDLKTRDQIISVFWFKVPSLKGNSSNG